MWRAETRYEAESVPKLAYLDPFFRPFDHLITEELGWDEAGDPIVQPSLHPNGLAGAGAAVKVIPDLERRGMQGIKGQSSLRLEQVPVKGSH